MQNNIEEFINNEILKRIFDVNFITENNYTFYLEIKRKNE